MIDFCLCHELQIERWLGRGVNREEYGEPVALRGRVNLVRGSELRGAAHARVASGRAYLPPDAPVDVGDRLRFDGQCYAVRAVARRCALDGSAHHLEVTLR